MLPKSLKGGLCMYDGGDIYHSGTHTFRPYHKIPRIIVRLQNMTAERAHMRQVLEPLKVNCEHCHHLVLQNVQQEHVFPSRGEG